MNLKRGTIGFKLSWRFFNKTHQLRNVKIRFVEKYRKLKRLLMKKFLLKLSETFTTKTQNLMTTSFCLRDKLALKRLMTS